MSAQFVRSGDNTKTYIFSQVVEWLPYKLRGGIYFKSLNTGSNPVLTTDNNNSGVRVLLALKGVCFQRFESESGG